MTDTFPSRRKLGLGATAIALLAVGGAGGAVAGRAMQPSIAMAPTHAVAIKSLSDDGGIVTVKGRVAETYGNQFTIEDGTGKALIDGGPAVEDGSLAPKGAIVSVQGRFDRGTLHPMFLIDPSGKVVEIGRGPGGPGGPGPHGPGPGEGPDRAPPPPPPAGVAPGGAVPAPLPAGAAAPAPLPTGATAPAPVVQNAN
ncbi:hypothetical protein AWL63_09865 [Sphingomonas panacis]|uniref:Bacterial OB-fold domain-containing protein n=1 Tax=Sphingomonas panacis TaxID=1560345 RepID=A0A1B3Z9Y4_9SPHN|nr:hypothetical protein [Sphingomonas panacis]AOH84233.1 hypothetical protein AWL63_09865 [Sphingomonas panacis]